MTKFVAVAYPYPLLHRCNILRTDALPEIKVPDNRIPVIALRT